MLMKSDQGIIASYLEDSSNLKGGFAEGLFLPKDEPEILETVKECASKGKELTLSSGMTGTTGGCIPFGGYILNTEKLDKIIDIDKKNKTAIVQAGVSLGELQKKLKELGLMYPPDPTEPSAFLGGNAATNASGSRSFRFGATRDWIKSLRVVLSTGEVLNINRGEKAPALRIPHYTLPKVKSSAGYFSKPDMDLIDLFIGSEGTLGIITELELNLIPDIDETMDVVAFFKTEEDAVNFAESTKQQKDLLTIEYLDKNSLNLLRPDYKRIPADFAVAVYFEFGLKNSDSDKWGKALERHNASLEYSWIAVNGKQKEELANFRHSMVEHINSEFKKHNSVKFATDIAVPDDKFREMLNYYNSKLRNHNSELIWVKFGHIGQNHLHVNLVPRTQNDIPLAKELVMEFVKKGISLGGTCSAEHGIGKIKHVYLREMFGASGISEMARIKKLFDPKCILNLDDIFPKELLT